MDGWMIWWSDVAIISDKNQDEKVEPLSRPQRNHKDSLRTPSEPAVRGGSGGYGCTIMGLDSPHTLGAGCVYGLVQSDSVD